MFEFSIARSYLTPKRKQLSVSIISSISILVIALVVWLVVVFFSVTDGLLENWVKKLVAITAPVRVTPTEEYYKSYYYLVDSISENSGYTLKSLAEKLESEETDPYDPAFDEEIPSHIPLPDVGSDGKIKDLAKLAKNAIEEASSLTPLTYKEFEVASGYLNLEIVSKNDEADRFTQGTFVGEMDLDNPFLSSTLMIPSDQDANHALIRLEDSKRMGQMEFHSKLKKFFESVEVLELSPKSSGWKIPYHLLQDSHPYRVLAHVKGTRVKNLLLPDDKTYVEENQNPKLHKATLTRIGDKLEVQLDDSLVQKSKLAPTMILIKDPVSLKATLDQDSIDSARGIDELVFSVHFSIQETTLDGKTALSGLALSKVETTGKSAPWIIEDREHHVVLDPDPSLGEPILIPKMFKDAGVGLLDQGYLSYGLLTASHTQEARASVYVAGFYDPGIIPIGGKYILARKDLTGVLRQNPADDKAGLTNGFNVVFSDLSKADDVKKKIQNDLKKGGIDRYFEVKTYKEYPFTKDIMQQLASEKNLFTILSVIVLIVACSNIISMLIILVNDKKIEIGILRALGATTLQIALIFGLCGLLMGVLGSILGSLLAFITLFRLDTLVSWISFLQGHELFNANFYGENLPKHVSMSALFLVFIKTATLSLLAGIIAAIKACLLKPSAILRNE